MENRANMFDGQWNCMEIRERTNKSGHFK